MQAEFNKIIKDLADKNAEKEKDLKSQCDSWITQQMQKKDDQTIDAFFEYIRNQASQSPSGSSLSQAAINAFGIFAHSIKGDEKLKEKYIPIILETLIECYFLNDSNNRVKPHNAGQKADHFKPTQCDYDRPVADLFQAAQALRSSVQNEERHHQ